MNKKLLVVVAIFVAALRAQTVQGVISGTVADLKREPIPGASVALISKTTGIERSSKTDAHGEFFFAAVPPGEYSLVATSVGAKVGRTITLDINQQINIELPLFISDNSLVMVEAASPMLRTETSTYGGVIDNRTITGVPLDGRNFYNLSLLLPGVQPPAQGSAGSVRGAFSIEVNGAREDANVFLLDGVYNGDPKLNGIGVTQSVDAIQEFEVATSTYDTTFGRNAGGQISVVTQSGNESTPRHGVRILPQRRAELAQLLRPLRSARSAVSAQSSRRDHRRSGQEKPDFLLWRFRNHAPQCGPDAGDRRSHCARTHRQFQWQRPHCN